MDAIVFTGDPDRDWLQFRGRYEAFIARIVPRFGVGEIGEATARGLIAALDDPDTAYLDPKTIQARR